MVPKVLEPLKFDCIIHLLCTALIAYIDKSSIIGHILRSLLSCFLSDNLLLLVLYICLRRIYVYAIDEVSINARNKIPEKNVVFKKVFYLISTHLQNKESIEKIQKSFSLSIFN